MNRNSRRLHLLIGGLCLLSVPGLAISSARAQQYATSGGDVATYSKPAPEPAAVQEDVAAPTAAPRKPAKRARVASAITTTTASATVAPPRSAKRVTTSRKPVVASAGEGPYYVDFRARTAASYGHAFVWYGKTSEKEVEVAGLHPKGDELPYMLGHLMWVPAETGASYGDLDEQYLTANYRVYLSEADAKTVFAYIKELQANSHFWNAETNNCTSFVGKIASFMGLKTPFHLIWPEQYINDMKEMNGGRTTVVLASRPESSPF